MIAAKGYYLSPIGGGYKIHIFRKGQFERALCLKGPAYTLWHETRKEDICKACLRVYEKECKE